MDEQQIINDVTEVAETVVPVAVETVEIVKNNPVLLAGVGLAGLALGGAAGYFFAKRRLESLMLDELEVRQEKLREYYEDYYQKVNKVEKYATAADAAAALLPDGVKGDPGIPDDVRRAMTDYAGVFTAPIEEDEEEIIAEVQEILVSGIDDDTDEPAVVERRNIFVNGQELTEDDYPEYDDANVDLTKPHIISKEAFFENGNDDEQAQITYYAGDDVLADTDDSVITEADALVGNHNLKFFGHLSEDINIVYIRNPKKGLSFEVARSSGTYAHEVQGFPNEDELRHEARSRRPRRSWDDD